MKFKNKSNGYTEEANLCWLWCLLFGSLYFAVRGVWTHMIVSFILAILTMGISWIFYPFFASEIIEKKYLRDGWTKL